VVTVLIGRTVCGAGQRPRTELMSVPEADVVPTGPNWFVGEPRIAPYSSDGELVVMSPFGRMVYNARDKELIADQLIRLAGEIRRRP
jgi:hypothetical protein